MQVGRRPFDSCCISVIFLYQTTLPVYQLNYHTWTKWLLHYGQNSWSLWKTKESLSHSRFLTTVNEILLLPPPQSHPLVLVVWVWFHQVAHFLFSRHSPLPTIFSYEKTRYECALHCQNSQALWDEAEIILHVYYLKVLVILDYFLHLSETTRISIHVGVFEVLCFPIDIAIFLHSILQVRHNVCVSILHQGLAHFSWMLVFQHHVVLWLQTDTCPAIVFQNVDHFFLASWSVILHHFDWKWWGRGGCKFG